MALNTTKGDYMTNYSLTVNVGIHASAFNCTECCQAVEIELSSYIRGTETRVNKTTGKTYTLPKSIHTPIATSNAVFFRTERSYYVRFNVVDTNERWTVELGNEIEKDPLNVDPAVSIEGVHWDYEDTTPLNMFTHFTTASRRCNARVDTKAVKRGLTPYIFTAGDGYYTSTDWSDPYNQPQITHRVKFGPSTDRPIPFCTREELQRRKQAKRQSDIDHAKYIAEMKAEGKITEDGKYAAWFIEEALEAAIKSKTNEKVIKHNKKSKAKGFGK